MWNQSQGLAAEAGSGLWLSRVRDVAHAVPLEEHLAGSDVDLLDDAVEDFLVGGTAHRGQVRGPDGVCEDQRRVPGRDEELVKVREVTVTGSHFGDLLVAVVVDVVGPAQALALEPREHRPALVGLARKSSAISPAGRAWNQTTLAELVRISRPFAYPFA